MHPRKIFIELLHGLRMRWCFVSLLPIPGFYLSVNTIPTSRQGGNKVKREDSGRMYTLMFPQPHNLIRPRARPHKIQQIRRQYSRHGRGHAPPILRGQKPRVPRRRGGTTTTTQQRVFARGGRTGVCKGEEDGASGLQGEVDREDGGLEGCELGAWEAIVGHDAADEGLEDGGAEESAVAVGGKAV